jgi:2,3,4,5-tetrahydropyridine-2-carboxylate N-succinyltransferase
MTILELAEEIEGLYEFGADADHDHARNVFTRLRSELSAGRIRAAEPDPSSATGWTVNTWVKKGILVGFRAGKTVTYTSADSTVPYLDKDTLPLKSLDPSSGVRLVPGGSSIRDGAYVGPGVICMPPMYINIGAYVGNASLIDSHALVGSCAQIGAHVHISAGAQIGGVLEPVGAMPVIVEDDALIGGNTGLYEGTVVQRRAVIGAGTVLTGSTPIFDLTRGEFLTSPPGVPTIIPEGAVVVPGARAVTTSPGSDWGISLATPIIVKYRDDRTDTRTELEAWIR